MKQTEKNRLLRQRAIRRAQKERHHSSNSSSCSVSEKPGPSLRKFTSPALPTRPEPGPASIRVAAFTTSTSAARQPGRPMLPRPGAGARPSATARRRTTPSPTTRRCAVKSCGRSRLTSGSKTPPARGSSRPANARRRESSARQPRARPRPVRSLPPKRGAAAGLGSSRSGRRRGPSCERRWRVTRSCPKSCRRSGKPARDVPR